MSSSTSNSKKRFRRISWGFVGFLLLFASTEVFVFRNLSFYSNPYDFVGQFNELNLSFEHSKPEQITTAVFGDSQSIDALRPHLLAGASGRDPASIFNFSITGGKSYEIDKTYLKYKDRMPLLKEAIIVVNEHQLNSFNIGNDIKFRYYAGIRDRMKVLDRNNYGELLAGWVSKAVDLRAEWSKQVDNYLKGKKPKPIVWKPGGIRARTVVEKEHLTMDWAKETADRWFEGYDLEGLETESFESLLSDLQAKGVQVVILQIPRSPEFETAVKEKYAVQQQQYFDKVAALAQKYGAEFEVMSNKGLTLKEHFRDTNHLNPKGTVIVSTEIARRWLVK